MKKYKAWFELTMRERKTVQTKAGLLGYNKSELQGYMYGIERGKVVSIRETLLCEVALK